MLTFQYAIFNIGWKPFLRVTVYVLLTQLLKHFQNLKHVQHFTLQSLLIFSQFLLNKYLRFNSSRILRYLVWQNSYRRFGELTLCVFRIEEIIFPNLKMETASYFGLWYLAIKSHNVTPHKTVILMYIVTKPSNITPDMQLIWACPRKWINTSV